MSKERARLVARRLVGWEDVRIEGRWFAPLEGNKVETRYVITAIEPTTRKRMTYDDATGRFR